MRYTCHWIRIFFLCTLMGIRHAQDKIRVAMNNLQPPLRAVEIKVVLWALLQLSLLSILGDCPPHPVLFLWYRTPRFRNPRTISGRRARTPWWAGGPGWPCSRSRRNHEPLGSRRWGTPSRNGHTPPGGHLQDRNCWIRNQVGRMAVSCFEGRTHIGSLFKNKHICTWDKPSGDVITLRIQKDCDLQHRFPNFVKRWHWNYKASV
jgi:hypothetical protein